MCVWLQVEMPPKRGRKADGAGDKADIISKMVEEANKATEVKEFINPVPQKEVILNNLVTYTGELSAEDAFRRKKLLIFTVAFLSSIVGLIIVFYSQHLTVLFQQVPLNWGYFGIGCVFFMPCFGWFFWTVCPRYPHCDWYCVSFPNYLFLGEHERRIFLQAQRDERKRVARMTHLYREGDIDPPADAIEQPDLPFEYDPAQPWAYKRWRPKPPVRVRYDQDGVAWIVTEEEQAAEEAARLAAAKGAKISEGKDGGYDYDDDEEVGGRKSSVVGRKSSVAVKA